MGKLLRNQYLNIGGLGDMSKIIKNNPVISAVVICLIFVYIAKIVSELYLFKDFDLWSLIDAYVTSLTLFLVFYSWKQNQKQMQKVGIYFNLISNDKEIPVDTNLTRKDCQRSEVQGILRTKLKKGKSFYEIDYLSNIKYVEQIFAIQHSESNKLVIYLQDDELEQFGLEK